MSDINATAWVSSTHRPMGFAEFVVLIAAIMALNPLAMDMMLPALPNIGTALHVEAGNHLQADFPGKPGAKPILLLGHYDTVYPMGTLATMPCRILGDKLTGPGVLDMKSGIAFMLHALTALQHFHDAVSAHLVALAAKTP